MIKDAMKHVQDLAAPNFKEHEGVLYSDKNLHEVKRKLITPLTLGVNTLSGVVDYIKNNLDNEDEYVIHILDYNHVVLYGRYDEKFCHRKSYVKAESDLKSFEFNRFMDVESFIISLISFFNPTPQLATLQSFVGSLSDDTSINLSDDGITQTATAKIGVVSKANVSVPNPVELIPYNTFPEIEGIPRKFVFRLKKQGYVSCAIFESGDTRWKIEYIQKIKTYFEEQLKDFDKAVSIIA